MDPFDDLFGGAPVVAAPPPPRATSNTVPTQGDDFGEFFVPASSPVVLSSSSHTNQQKVKEGEDDGFGDFAGSGSGVPQAEFTKGDDLDFGKFEGIEASPSSSQPPARERPDHHTSPPHHNGGSSNEGATATSPPKESSKSAIDDIFGDFGSLPQPAAPLEVATSSLIGNRTEADDSPSPQELPITAPPSRLNKPPIAPEIGIAATDVPVHTVGTLDDDDFGDFGSAPPSPVQVEVIREEGTYSQPIQQEEPNEQQPPTESSPESSPQKEEVSTPDQPAAQVQEVSIASGADEDEFGDFGSPVPPTVAEEVPHVEAFVDSGEVATSPLQTSTEKDDEPTTLKKDGEDDFGDFGSCTVPVEVPQSQVTGSDSTANPIVLESEEAGFGTFESSPVINSSPDIEASCIPVDSSNQNSNPRAETTDEEFGDFGVATPPPALPLQPVSIATETQAQTTEQDHTIPRPEEAENENEDSRFASSVVDASAVGIVEASPPDGAVITSVQKQAEVIEGGETAFGDFGESPLPDAPTQQLPEVANPMGDADDDDFGDFEESAQAPVTDTIPPPTTSKNNAEEVDDDDFGDFGSADPMPLQQPQLPVVVASINPPANQVKQSNAKFDRQLVIMQEGFKELQQKGASKKPLFASSATKQQLDEDALDWWVAQDGIMGKTTSKIRDCVSIQRDADALLTAAVESSGIGRFVTINGSDMSSHDPKSLAAFLSLEALASNGGADARTRRQAESLSSYAAASPLPAGSPTPPPPQPQRPVAARFRPLIRDQDASDGAQTFNEPEAAPVYGSIRASGWAFYRYLMPMLESQPEDSAGSR